MSATAVSPDERAFRAHVAGGRFQAGVDRGEWRLVSIDWPHAVIAISAAPRAGAPTEFFLRFELTGYPNTGATAALWDPETQALLPDRTRPKVTWRPSPFRSDWQAGRALYLACDRVAASGHTDWPSKYPGDLWDTQRGISKYVRIVHDLLHEDAYTGI
jgi:hypothetical protein